MKNVSAHLLTVVILATVAANAQATVFDFKDDGGEYPPGALVPGDGLPTISAEYSLSSNFTIGEHADEAGDGSLGECCGDVRFLNVGSADEGNLHWFVNIDPGYHIPAGSTLSVSFNNNTGGPTTLKAYAGSIAAADATIANANSGAAFGGLVGETTFGPEQFPTLNLVLPANARSFTVHQSDFDFENNSDFITGELPDGTRLAPNVSVNGMTFDVELIPEPTSLLLAGLASLGLVGVRRR